MSTTFLPLVRAEGINKNASRVGDATTDSISLKGAHSMFKNNKYTAIYQSIIHNARERVLEGYTESHHIIPVSLGGSDEDRVNLTPREHYIVHRLLTHMTEGEDRSKMIFALWAMSNQKGEFRPERNYTVPGRVYERLRQEAINQLRKTNKGRKYPNRKRPEYSEEERKRRAALITEMNKKRAGRPVSEETREKIRQKRALQDMSHMKGRIVSEETRAKISAAVRKNLEKKGEV